MLLLDMWRVSINFKREGKGGKMCFLYHVQLASIVSVLILVGTMLPLKAFVQFSLSFCLLVGLQKFL